MSEIDDIDDRPKALNEIEMNITCMYGSSMENSTYQNAKNNSKDTILNYSLCKIRCQLCQNHIVGLQFFYKNRTDGSEAIFLNVEPPKEKKDIIEQEMDFSSFENIIDVRVWLKDVKLIGFEIETSKGRIQKFGYGDDNDLIRICDFENKDMAVVSFGTNSDDKEGVTGLEMNFLEKKKYLIVLYSGFSILRFKLRNEEFKKNIQNKISTMEQRLQILYRTCLLPDNSYFGVMKFALS